MGFPKASFLKEVANGMFDGGLQEQITRRLASPPSFLKRAIKKNPKLEENTLISVRNLNKYYGSTPVLLDLNFEIKDDEKIGIVGKNGSGKTTLFNILSGKLDYDGGDISLPKGASMGIIDQIPSFNPDFTVEDVLKSAFLRISELKEKAQLLERKMAEGDHEVLDEYSKVLEKIDHLGGYNYDFEIDIVANGLDISESMRKKPFLVLSGGEKTRVNLARIILEKTDILLLDEPTNHLDLNATIWLTNYLENYKGTVIVISHDRYFLDEVVTRILEIEDNKMHEYLGNYSYYAVEKEERVKRQLEIHLREAEELKKLQDASRKMHQWGTERMHKRAFSIDKRIAKMKVTDRPKKEKQMKVTFVNTDYQTSEILKVNDLAKEYDGRVILKNFAFDMRNGDKIAIIGDNGTGKSTFLKILLGEEQKDSGRIKKGIGVKTGYLPQLVKFSNPERNLIDTLIYEKNVSAQTARNRLGSFKFSGEDQLKTVEKLSGGEKSRLRLCTLMYDDINVLILDEPTNHLDIMSREWIEEAIEEFDGSLIFVSHDRYFISRFANKIIEMTKDGYYLFKGNYEEYVKAKQDDKLDFFPKDTAPKPVIVREKPKSEKPKGIDKVLEKKIKNLEREIKTLDEKIAQIELEMNDCGADFEKLHKLSEEKDELDLTLLEKMEEWDSLLV